MTLQRVPSTQTTAGRTYLLLVENERVGGRIKQRVLHRLGRLDQLVASGEIDSLLSSPTTCTLYRTMGFLGPSRWRRRPRAIRAKGHGQLQWQHILDDLDGLQEIELTVQGKVYRLRTETKGTLAAVFNATGVALPATLRSM